MTSEIRLDFSNVMSENLGGQHGLTQEILRQEERLEAIRSEVLLQPRGQRLPFLDLPFDIRMLDKILTFSESNRDKFDYYVHLGIGGSALGPVAIHTALQHQFFNLLPRYKRSGSPQIFFIDNIDPDTIGQLLDVIDVSKTLFSVVSKSGGTPEVMAHFLLFLEELKQAVGNGYRKQLVFITDPESGFLRKIAKQEKIASFAIPAGVGGRFSVLTPVGLLSAAMAGIDISSMLQGAAAMSKRCSETQVSENPAFTFALINTLYYGMGKQTVVMMPYSDRLYRVADWFRQLWAESLGKKTDLDGQEVSIGPLPVKALGAVDQHSQVQLYLEGPNDKLFVFIEVDLQDSFLPLKSPYKEFSESEYLDGKNINELLKTEKRSTEFVLTENQRPNLTIRVPEISPHALGQLFQCLEIATVVAGHLFRINPFDQPAVEGGKIATYAFMGREGFESQREEIVRKLNRRVKYQV